MRCVTGAWISVYQSGVATQFGVWEFGRLANDNQLLFGELPSETLRDVR